MMKRINNVTGSVVLARLNTGICLCLLVCILALFSSQVKAEAALKGGQVYVEPQPDGRKFLSWSRGGSGYRSAIEVGNDSFYWVNDASYKVTGKGTIKTGAVANVGRSPVLAGLLRNARKFKKLGGGWGGVAFSLVSPYLAEKGFEWLEDAQDFAKYKPNADGVCIIGSNNSVNNKCVDQYGMKGEIHALPEAFANSQLNDILVGFCNSYKGPYFEEPAKDGDMHINGPWCQKGNSLTATWRLVKIDYTTLTQPEFDSIIGPHADEEPSPYVNASKSELNELPDGARVNSTVSDTAAQSKPFIDPVTGQVSQANFSFQNNTNSNTTYNVNIFPSDAKNPEQPEPVKDKDKDKDDENVDWPTTKDPDLQIPEKKIPLDFQLPNLFSSSGTCPRPLQFDIPLFGTTVHNEFSYEKICNAFSILNPIFIAGCIVSCAFVVFATIRTL